MRQKNLISFSLLQKWNWCHPQKENQLFQNCWFGILKVFSNRCLGLNMLVLLIVAFSGFCFALNEAHSVAAKESMLGDNRLMSFVAYDLHVSLCPSSLLYSVSVNIKHLFCYVLLFCFMFCYFVLCYSVLNRPHLYR